MKTLRSYPSPGPTGGAVQHIADKPWTPTDERTCPNCGQTRGNVPGWDRCVHCNRPLEPDRDTS